MKPDATKHNPDPDYLQSLLDQAGMGKRRAAELVGIGARDLRYMVRGDKTCPYSVQFCLECLAEDSGE